MGEVLGNREGWETAVEAQAANIQRGLYGMTMNGVLADAWRALHRGNAGEKR